MRIILTPRAYQSFALGITVIDSAVLMLCDCLTVGCDVCRAFDKLRSVREMEYELDFVTNRANRDTQVHRNSSLCLINSMQRYLR